MQLESHVQGCDATPPAQQPRPERLQYACSVQQLYSLDHTYPLQKCLSLVKMLNGVKAALHALVCTPTALLPPGARPGMAAPVAGLVA